MWDLLVLILYIWRMNYPPVQSPTKVLSYCTFSNTLSVSFVSLASKLLLNRDDSIKKKRQLFVSNSKTHYIQSIQAHSCDPPPTADQLLPNLYDLSFFPLFCCSLKTLWIKPSGTTKALGSLHQFLAFLPSPSIHSFSLLLVSLIPLYQYTSPLCTAFASFIFFAS